MTMTQTPSTQKPPSIATWLGKMGTALKSKHQKSYQALDLSQNSTLKLSAFYQRSNLSQQLFGQRASVVQSLASKFVPQGVFDDISHQLYTKLVQVAKTWAVYALKKDERFLHLSALSAQEKDEFADDIANQNRALAALGGVTGFLGLAGVVLDTAWLLLVSLRTIYQLALVYDAPVSQVAGLDLAQQILSKMDLDKLGQKQVLLTALALGDKILVNAQSTSLKDALSTIIASHPVTGGYKKQFDELLAHINLDKLDRFNTSWLHYLLPITSMAVGGYYNRELIDDVIGMMMATFRQEHEPLLLEQRPNKSLEN